MLNGFHENKDIFINGDGIKGIPIKANMIRTDLCQIQLFLMFSFNYKLFYQVTELWASTLRFGCLEKTQRYISLFYYFSTLIVEMLPLEILSA